MLCWRTPGKRANRSTGFPETTITSASRTSSGRLAFPEPAENRTPPFAPRSVVSTVFAARLDVHAS